MEESEGSQPWLKRMSWAQCAEPHKTILDTLASHWIECQLSHAEAALEILRVRTVIADTNREAKDKRRRLSREIATLSQELDILATAVAEASADTTSDVPHRRYSWFSTCLKQARAIEFRGR